MAKGKKKKHMLFKTILIIAVLSAVTFCSLTGYICIREGKAKRTTGSAAGAGSRGLAEETRACGCLRREGER